MLLSQRQHHQDNDCPTKYIQIVILRYAHIHIHVHIHISVLYCITGRSHTPCVTWHSLPHISALLTSFHLHRRCMYQYQINAVPPPWHLQIWLFVQEARLRLSPCLPWWYPCLYGRKRNMKEEKVWEVGVGERKGSKDEKTKRREES